MNFLNIPQIYIERIQHVYKIVKSELPESEIYLFGSYAKRKIKTTSDMDVLVLITDDLTKKELKEIKWHIEEIIETSVNFEYEVDLKIYTKDHFNSSSATIGFESEIAKYMIRLEENLWK